MPFFKYKFKDRDKKTIGKRRGKIEVKALFETINSRLLFNIENPSKQITIIVIRYNHGKNRYCRQ